MALLKRKINGIEYLYAVAGKKHLFLGRSDDLDNMDQKNLAHAQNMMCKTAVKTLERYVRDTHDYAKLVNGSERIEYLKKMESILLEYAKQISKWN